MGRFSNLQLLERMETQLQGLAPEGTEFFLNWQTDCAVFLRCRESGKDPVTIFQAKGVVQGGKFLAVFLRGYQMGKGVDKGAEL